MRRSLLAVSLGACFLAAFVSVQHAQEKPAQKKNSQAQSKRANQQLLPTAMAFLATLDAEQAAKAVMEFNSAQRVKWHFIPMDTRKGLPLMEMKDEQKTAAMQLLRATVSNVGYDKASTIMQLEGVLRQLEGPGSEARRNPEKYYFTLFGTVAQRQRWGLSIEGHHLSLNFVMRGNQILDSTPQFFASNPAELKDSYGDKFPKGTRVLKDEEQLAFELMQSLDESQKKAAMLAGDVPSEIRAAGEPQPPGDDGSGIAASQFSDAQQATLKKLLEAYSGKMKAAVAKKRWELIEQAGFDNIRLSWSGADRPGVGHYYRIQGPTFLVEFINVQPDAAGNPANHIHCVWRDMQGDFDLPIAAK